MRRGFTLIEALVSTTIAALAGSALLLGVSSSLQNTTTAVEQTLGAGLAAQLLDEIAGRRYFPPTGAPYETTLAPSAYESGGTGRERYGEIGDFNGIRNTPPRDLYGQTLGAENGQGGLRHAALRANDYFSNWTVEVDVYYVSSTDLSARLATGLTSDYRVAEVRIYVRDAIGGQRLVTQAKRVFSYAPTL